MMFEVGDIVEYKMSTNGVLKKEQKDVGIIIKITPERPICHSDRYYVLWIKCRYPKYNGTIEELYDWEITKIKKW